MTPADRASLYARFVHNHTALVPTLIAGVGLRRMPDSLAIAMIDGTSAPSDLRHRYLDTSLARHWRSQMEMKKAEWPRPDCVASLRISRCSTRIRSPTFGPWVGFARWSGRVATSTARGSMPCGERGAR